MLTILVSASASGHNGPCSDTLGARIYFRTGRSDLEPSFRDNAAALSGTVGMLRRLQGDTTVVFRQLRLEAGSSPEGSNTLNERLSRKRGAVVRDYFMREVPLADSLVSLGSQGVDWEGLLELVEASDMPYRDEVLDILHNTPEWIFSGGKVVDGRKRRLGMLRGGRPWNYMHKHFFPELRGASIRVVCRYDTIPDYSSNMKQAADFSFKANISADKALAAAARAEREAEIAVGAASEAVAAAREALAGGKRITPEEAAAVRAAAARASEAAQRAQSAADAAIEAADEAFAEAAEARRKTEEVLAAIGDVPADHVARVNAEAAVAKTQAQADEAVERARAAAEKAKRAAAEAAEAAAMAMNVTAEAEERVRLPLQLAIKSNLLYDAALVPNIGIEFYLGRGWTIGASYMHAWWKSDRRHNYWRTYGAELDVRKYFGRLAKRKPLAGHHIGLYAQALTYDFELGGKGYMGGIPGGSLFDKASYGVGIEYGYSLPIGRRLNLDFGIGIGYLGGEYRVYDPMDTHYIWQQTKQRHWFGPTKAEVSLVWLIGRGNCNEKKGGKR